MAFRTPLTRRDFIKKTALAAGAAAGFPAIIPARALGAESGSAAASGRITLGFIGLGPEGLKVNLAGALGSAAAQVVALCDCDAARLAEAGNAAADAKTYRDWREVIARDDIDAVVISTPDHWHVPMALAAVRAGKDVMLEKPVSLTVAEGRLLSDEAARLGRVCQVAGEFRALAPFHQAAQTVRNGRLGKLRVIRTALGVSPDFPGDPTPMPVPPELDYEMWLGPAPWASYTKDRVHYNFRWISDYSGGQFSDWGSHLFDVAQCAMGTEQSGPEEVEGKGKFLSAGLFDTAVKFNVEYHYANGVRLLASHLDPVMGDAWGCIRFEGERGWIQAGYFTGLSASSPELANAFIAPGDVHLYTDRRRETHNFLECVRSRREPFYPLEIGHRSATVAHLGNIAMKLGRKLKWDPAKEEVKGDAEANRMLGRTLRDPWKM